MKVSDVFESEHDNEHNEAEFQRWIKACCAKAPNSKVVGTRENGAQAIDYESEEKTLVGKWDHRAGKGTVYGAEAQITDDATPGGQDRE